jgi:hypothetical protein
MSATQTPTAQREGLPTLSGETPTGDRGDSSEDQNDQKQQH